MLTDSLGGIFIFLGKIAVAVANTFIAYALILNWPYISDKLNSPIGPLICIFIVSYLIASIFMTIFAISSNALVQCFLTDIELSKKGLNGQDNGTVDGKNRPKELDDLVQILKKKN